MLRIGIVQRISAVLLLSLVVGSGAIATSMATAQDATPAAANLPEGPLGEQIQWLVDYINMPAADAAAVDLTTKFTPGVLADVPADQLAVIIGNLRDQLAPVTIDTASLVTTEDLPPTNANFVLVGRDGTRQPVSLTVAPDTGLIGSIWFSTQLPPAPTPVVTATSVPTETATAAPTETATELPTETLTPVPTETATEFPTETSTAVPTETPTEVPTQTPSPIPTETATEVPTETPTEAPTETATEVPTETATLAPTETPTAVPTDTLTPVPTDTPTEVPTETATLVPTKTSTAVPTETATLVPTETPTNIPTETATTVPTETPTEVPTETPTAVPTETATDVPTHTPTEVPTETATAVPTETETSVPTETETAVPTETETLVPTKTPTTAPTETETLVPTETETEVPTETATNVPTETPTLAPTKTATEAVVAAATEAASPIASEGATVSGSPVTGSPIASPVASPFGDSDLGRQAAWTWSILNNGGTPISESEIEAHTAPKTLAQVPAAQVAAGIAQIQQLYGPFTIETDSMIVTENEPPTNLSYVIVGKDGTRLQVSVSIDPASGLLTGFLISPATGSGTPVAVSLPSGLTDTEVTFTSGNDTLYSSFLAPTGDFAAGETGAAALIISGSGPTDRNGNSGNLSMNTNLNLAITLAQEGIPSLRYDKLGSGQTGLGSHADGAGIDDELFQQEARDAATFLAEQPGVDPSKLILVGHSEGALFALVLAKELTDAGTPPTAVILAAPLSVRYLDILHEQLTAQFKAAVAAQTMTDDQAAKITTELESIIDSLRTTGTLPATVESSELAQIFSPANAAFLAQIDKIDPAEVAASLPDNLPVLVLLGAKDAQVAGDQVRHLLDGFKTARNTNVTFVALPKADHTLRIVEGAADPAVDYANPDLSFSPQAVSAIDDFLAKHGLSVDG